MARSLGRISQSGYEKVSRIVTGTEVAACQLARLSLSRFGDVFAVECVTTDVMGSPPHPPPISFLSG